MEAAASVSVAARVSMTAPTSQSQSSRKEWRVVSDHPVQNSGNEDLGRSKLGHGDERLIYEGTEPVGVDFFPITATTVSDHELSLDDVVKQREQFQHLEVTLKAHLMARSEVMEMQERFDSQIKEHITANVKLQEQLHEKERIIQDLQRALEDKDKELHAVRLDHEAVWAKEDLLREQNKELATFRRERDNSEAERAQHIKKIHDLQEHIEEKDRQLIEMQEQHRVAQETIIYKDEQIREAHAWITRVQEMDAMQSTANHSLQAELRERTEQYNQLWLGCQRQFAEMERHHLHALQQLQQELSKPREKSGTNSDESQTTQRNPKDSSHFGHSNGSHLEANVGSTSADILGRLQNGSVEVVPSFASTGSASIQALSDDSRMQNYEPYPSEHNRDPLRPETSYDHEVPVTRQAVHSDHLDVHFSQGLESHSAVPSPNMEGQSLQQISSQFHRSLRLDRSDHDIRHQEKNANTFSIHGIEAQSSTAEKPKSAAGAPEAAIQSVKFNGSTQNKVSGATVPEGLVVIGKKSSALVGNIVEMALLDEESLLACVVRTIPPGPGGRIQISEKLLNRLTKMLAPLHWSDYKKKYGELVDFLGGHPELFLIEGNHIQVREGAQEIIAAMAARAKLRAAAVVAAASSSHSSLLSSVSVTPMAQSRPKKAPFTDSNSGKVEKSRSVDARHPNGASMNAVGGISTVRILSKHNDQLELNGRPRQSNLHLANGNVTNLDRGDLGGSRGKVFNHGGAAPNFSEKQQNRRG